MQTSGVGGRRGRARARARAAAASPRSLPGSTHRVLPARLGELGSGHAPDRVLTLPGPDRRLPERAGPSPGKPSPRPRPLLARRPQPRGPSAGAGAAGIAATGGSRGAGRGSRLPREKRRVRLPTVAASRCREYDFSFAPARLLQSLEDLWKREGIGPAWTPFGGRPGGYSALHFLQITDFLEVSSGVAHSHPLISIRISIVQMQKLRLKYLQRLAQDV